MNEAVTRFLGLWARFGLAHDWVSRGYASRGWRHGHRTLDPIFERDIKEFEDKVQKPMDQAWSELAQHEREYVERECARRGRGLPASVKL